MTTHPPGRRYRLLIALLSALSLLAGTVAAAGAAEAAVDYTRGVTATGATRAKIWFRPTVSSTLVDVHYTFPGQSQQDFRMTDNGGTWEKTIPQSLVAGTVVTYWFTYNRNGANQGDTPHFTYTHGGGGGGGGGGSGPDPGGPGTFPMVLRNTTNGAWADSQIYVTIIGMASPGEWSYLRPNGSWAHIDHAETD